MIVKPACDIDSVDSVLLDQLALARVFTNDRPFSSLPRSKLARQAPSF